MDIANNGDGKHRNKIMNTIKNPAGETVPAPPKAFSCSPLLLNIEQTASALNFSTKTVRRLIVRGKFRPCKAVRKILIPTWQIEAFIKETCGMPPNLR